MITRGFGKRNLLITRGLGGSIIRSIKKFFTTFYKKVTFK